MTNPDQNLRDRIADILDINIDGHWNPHTIADTLIDALKLRQEWTTSETLMLGTVKTRKPDNAIATRYASPWTHLPETPEYCLRCGIPHTTPCQRPHDA